METEQHDRVLGARFRYWLGLVVEREIRRCGVSVERAADASGLSKESFVNFMGGKSKPHNEEGVVAAVAKLCQVDEPRSLYAEALKQWMRHGYRPEPSQPKSRMTNSSGHS